MDNLDKPQMQTLTWMMAYVRRGWSPGHTLQWAHSNSVEGQGSPQGTTGSGYLAQEAYRVFQMKSLVQLDNDWMPFLRAYSSSLVEQELACWYSVVLRTHPNQMAEV